MTNYRRRFNEMGRKRHKGIEADSQGRSDAASGTRRGILAFAAVALGVFIVLWAATDLAAGSQGFAMQVSDTEQGVEEAASALARFFAALVLGLFLTGETEGRMRWVAGGLVVLGLGHLIFGYLEPLIQEDPTALGEGLYEAFVTQTFACALFIVGLWPASPPRALRWVAIVAPLALVAGYVLIFEFLEGEEWMPPLTTVENPKETLDLGASFGWLTPWHWVLSALPLGLAIAATAGAFLQSRRGLLPGWLLFAMVLFAGSLLHGYLWPSTYGGERILTTADSLALASAVVVAVGGIAELRRVALERAQLLATERERIRRLGELNVMRADFSAMVAHELGGPIGAIRKLTELLGVEGSDDEIREYVKASIEGEIDMLDTLVSDVRSAAAVERADFEVNPRPLALGALLAEIQAYASTLPGDHPVKTIFVDGAFEDNERVWADPERIGQVLRNLLSNAAKYSPEETPIELRVIRKGQRIRLEVADHGPGISPDDLRRIFEKFGRGRDLEGRKVSGVGLGLYLSRRIVQSHGSELTVHTRLGEGSTFGFDLEVVTR
jgi:signal transduction histidine kinase